ncbi:MAG: efflux RND transporter periplasmic adaptor subunit [Gammaproteobacteria bacterium]|nr:efflux RND transporter periplasmic adaptor subunit [Gammaproteobacteria bacterium]
MKKWIVGLLALTSFIVVAIFLTLHVLHKDDQKTKEAFVTVTEGSISDNAEAIGYIKPVHSIIVKSAVNGIVAKIFHYEGEQVKKGEALAEIKPQPAPESYAEAYEAVTSAIAKEKAAYQDLQRFKYALSTKLISKDYGSYIAAKQNYDSAKAERELAEQQLALLTKGSTRVANKKLANVVVSPIAGFILSRNVDTGDPVISLSSAQSATPLFVMANMQDLMFEGSVDELDAAKIKPGMKALITVGAEPDRKIEGVVSKIALQSDQENSAVGFESADSNLPFNVSFKIEITKLKLPINMLLRSGYSATADVKLKVAKNILVLPERVIHFEKDRSYVFLANHKKNYVKLGVSDNVNVEIKSGLRLGDKVLDD